jgi:hypothetical protein
MTSYLIACGFTKPPSAVVSKALGLDNRLRLARGELHPELWMSRQEFPEIEPALARFLASGDVRTATFLTTVPRPEQRWVLSHWPGRLAAHRHLADQVDPRWWTPSASYELIDLISFAPATRTASMAITNPATGAARRTVRWVETVAEYRASLQSTRPTLINAPVQQIMSKLPEWFGDLADERVGGAIALLALSGVTASTKSMVVLRNPAAFGLRRVTGDGSLTSRYLAGQVDVHAFGISSSGPAIDVGGRLFWRPRARTRTTWPSAFGAAADAGYGTSITLTAGRHTEVLIETGLVFEQLALNGVQNLAIAAGAPSAVPAARPTTVSLPAWCLNRELAPPAGQEIRPTPLVLPLPARTSQATVWSAMEQTPDPLRMPT